MALRRSLALAALGLILGAPRSQGADAEKLPEGESVDVVVTASKHGQKITEAPAAVTVLTSEDIMASGAVSVADLFRRVPGLDFMQTSARDYNVNARGFNNTLSRRLLVLVDGRSVYLDLMGFTLWDAVQVPMEDIERIEIVRGPGSALYGANATSGVVNIITKSPRDIDGTSVRLAYGEFGSWDAGVLTAGVHGRFGFKAGASYFQTEAFGNPDRDLDSEFQREGAVATKQPKGSFRIGVDGKDGSRWVLDGGYGATTGTLYTGIGPLDIQPGSYSPFLRTAYTRGNLYLQAFWNGLSGETLNLTSLQTNHFTTNAYDLECQYNLKLGSRHYLVLGGNARRADIASDLTSRDETESTFGLYAQDEVKISDRLTGNVAIRVDHDDSVGTAAAPKGGLVFAINPEHSLRLTVATAYNSASFIESYLDYVVKLPLPAGGTLDVAAHGNTELEPERIISYELGYRAFPLRGLLLDANVFHARMKNFVQFIATELYAPGVPKTYTYINAGEATETGLEVSAEYGVSAHLSLSGNYTWSAVEQDEEVSDVTARHKAGIGVQYVRDRGFNGSLAVSYSGALDFPPSTAFYPAGVIPAYTVVNGAASWRFLEGGGLSVGLRGTNLLDNRHREFIAGDIIERKVLAEIRYRF